MSANKNLYDLLGNDVSDDEKEFVAPREVVKPQTSTKKSGVNPKADKSKARKAKPQATGNAAAAKYQNENRAVEGPKTTKRKGVKGGKNERRSHTGKVDTAKAQRVRLGDEADAQEEGEEDAEAEEAALKSEDLEENVVYKSYEDYLKEQAAKQAPNTHSAPASADSENLAEGQIGGNEEEVFFAATAQKKTRTRSKKEKKLLDAQITVSDGSNGSSAPRGGRGERAPRGRGDRAPRGGRGDRAPRGGRGDRAAKGGKRGDSAAAPAGKKPQGKKAPVNKLDDKNFPSL